MVIEIFFKSNAEALEVVFTAGIFGFIELVAPGHPTDDDENSDNSNNNDEFNQGKTGLAAD